MERKKILFLVEIPMFATLAFILDFFPFLSFKLWAQGGSVSFSMVPVLLVAFRWGIKGGIYSGLLFGLLNMLFGGYVFTPVQAALDYIVAFGAIGLSGVFSHGVRQANKNGHKKRFLTYITFGALIGSTVRFLCHFIAGIVFFSQYTPEGQTVWYYALWYNGSYMLPSFLLSTIILSLLFYKQPRLLRT
ncbi:thiamine transporter ThiT [Pontibacillus halophilus JSM 076056 = DSM 19796]|uniref:Thiamine transporter ThiT n=1 Tax=Pontibacillus halophilus JSM 076056 = DSM 19796 TaxID=1385510 RepID=A0A0A5GEJ3_9BACI|nr:energy-coupled thiamine transporter ThiT [Pontibacillus halophilus]KGX91636.1 thiamine transporter ThiT [Pontibacillus halophilus JSM 076056 = DSM 19796]